MGPVGSDGKQSVQSWFSQVSQASGSRAAVKCNGATLSFAQLDCLSNQLAHFLISRGGGPDSIVGLCVERSANMAIGVLGILKADAAYLPLDPVFPEGLTAQMVRDAGVSLIVTQALHAHRFSGTKATLVCLDLERELLARESQLTPTYRAVPDNLAYVMYTSGSTGRPKGVALPHRSLLNLLEWHLETIEPAQRGMLFASVGFDASFHELFAAWLCGGSIAIVPENLRRDPPAIAQFMREHAIEKAIVPVVLLRQLAEYLPRVPQALSSLRELMATGEQLVLTDAVRDLFRSMRGCRLRNHYGPSETHVVTELVLDGPTEKWPSHVPIGFPITATQIHLLDGRMLPVADGELGELYIGGVSLARGYLNRRGMTAARFVADPFAALPGSRMYCTGDFARRLPGGAIEFVGRMDDQVKIRGFRVEIGQVEAALLEHPSVVQAAVVASTRNDHAYLIAYCVTDDGRARVAGQMRQWLAAKLPDYMIPAQFVFIAVLPLTGNQKVDRRALALVEEVKLEGVEAATPVSAPERFIAGLWGRLLGRQCLDVQTSFFEMGGDSIRATGFIADLRAMLGIDIPVRLIFASPTIAELVVELGRALGGARRLEDLIAVIESIEALPDETVREMLATQATVDHTGLPSKDHRSGLLRE